MNRLILLLFFCVPGLFALFPVVVNGADGSAPEKDRFSVGPNIKGDVSESSRSIAEAYNNRAIALVERGEYDKAIEDFTKALELAPEYAEAYNNRGAPWFYKGYYDRAIADYTKALQLNPEYATAYHNRGIAWFYRGDLNRAADDYSRALEINPRYAEAFFNRGIALTLKGDYAGALQDCRRAIELKEDYAEAYNQLAWILSVCPSKKCRDGSEALEMARKAVNLRPEAPSYLDSLGAAYAEAGDFHRAVETQERAVALLEEKQEGKGLGEYKRRLRSYREGRPWRIGVMKTQEKPSPEGKSLGKGPTEIASADSDKKKPPGLIDEAEDPGPDVGLGKADSRERKKYAVQVGAFLNPDNAKGLKGSLQKKGYDVQISRKVGSEGRVWYRVILGGYNTLGAAKKAAAEFSAQEKRKVVVRRLVKDELL